MYQYLLTPAEDLARASELGLPLVHLAFSIDPEGLLRHAPLPEACRGGLMMVGTGTAPAEGIPDQAVRDILALCREWGFRGVVLDAEGPPTRFLSRLIQKLDRGLERQERGFFLPEQYASFTERAFLCLSSALSGGSLEVRLREAAETYGPRRLVLALERTAEIFPLPAPKGSGKALTPAELEALLCRLNPQVHFSRMLCAHYFTYLDRQSCPRFVLFDRADSLRRKRDTAEQLGFTRFFLLYPQLEDLLPELLD